MSEEHAWWCRECEGYKLCHTRPKSGDRFCSDCSATCILVPDVRPLAARISALETLAHAAIELRRQVGTDAAYLPETEAFDAAVKGAGL